MGWVKGVHRALDEPCKAFFPHTFGLTFSEYFWLNLTVVRLAREFPWACKGLPYPPLGSFAGFRSAKTVRLLGTGSAFWIRLRFLETVWLSLCSPFSDGLRRRRLCRHRLHYNLPLSCAKFELIYHTSLDSLCAGQVKLSSARFNQTVIILRNNLVN